MTIALIATSHGTAAPAARTAVSALVGAVREASPHLDVHEGFVDVQAPSVADVVDSVDGPAVVVPLLLAPGFHVRIDIQQAVTRRSAVAAATLGPLPRLTRTLLAKLARAGATKDDIIVLGAAGSSDPRAHRSVEAAARLLGAAWGCPVPVGHVGGSGTPIDEVVGTVSTTGRRVVVASYLVAPGYFHDRLASCGAGLVTRPLLDGTTVDPDLVSLVLGRFAEAARHLTGAVRPTGSLVTKARR